MINFYYELETERLEEEAIRKWLESVIHSEHCNEGELSFVFCDDEYLLEMNMKFLGHNTYTDIITFDNCLGKELHGDLYISLERVRDNASIYGVSVQEEIRRVVVHGVLHLCGYKDKTTEESAMMRAKENEKLKLFHVEQ